MKGNPSFASASAGSGKTYHLTATVRDRLVRGVCRPGGLIATTFTVKAAQELRERLRIALDAEGQPTLAERLDEGLIGTVHSVCSRLLERFAFEAGISPILEILSESQAAALLSESVETVADFDTIERLQALAARLGQQTPQTRTFLWKEEVRKLIEAVQTNDLAPETLPAIAQQSADELAAFLPPVATDNLDDALASALRATLRRIQANGDRTAGTQNYLRLLRDRSRDLEGGRLRWSDWVKLSKEQPTKASQADAAPLRTAAARFESHPRLRTDIRTYTATLFDLAGRSLDAFRRAKEEQGLLDFSDLEQRALRLLRDVPSVKAVLRDELDLLVVDEFQDTSPIQLALFVELAECAHETLWVGDLKQAIFGFRASDPTLVSAVIESVQRAGRMQPPLDRSYRAVPDLVTLTNALFAPPFARSLGLPPAQVELQATRAAPPSQTAAIEFLELSSGASYKGTGAPKPVTKEQFASALAERLAQWFRPPSLGPGTDPRPPDPPAPGPRPLGFRDVAVLCRQNNEATQLAAALRARGLPVALAQTGLWSTPEARLAAACLRRLADPNDTLATAEILTLHAAQDPDRWLPHRLEYLEQRRASPAPSPADRWATDGPNACPAIQAIDRSHSRVPRLSPAEALDLALDAGQVFATVSAWGPTTARAAQRRANLEALRGLARQYEDSCATRHLPPTVGGFLLWCDDVSASDEDATGLDDQIDAIHVVTYHKAKGLEWPVVVCTGLDSEPRNRLWGLSVAPVDPNQTFDPARPLDNRRLRFWVWPFGSHKTGIPLADRADASPSGLEATRVAQQEELRLLYVGFTRARDRLVLARDPARPAPWLDLLEAPWFTPQTDHIQLPAGTRIPADSVTIVAPDNPDRSLPDPHYAWFPATSPHTAKTPARLKPSQQPKLTHATVGRVIDFGARMPLLEAPDDVALGDALHGILAAELNHPNHPARAAAAQRILRGYALDRAIAVADVLAMVDRFRQQLAALFDPRSLRVEIPFEHHNHAGQRLTGFIDLALETARGWVVVDHKSFRGGRPEWPAKALEYTGQLDSYRAALEATGHPVIATCIHFAVGGGLVEVHTAIPKCPDRVTIVT